MGSVPKSVGVDALALASQSPVPSADQYIGNMVRDALFRTTILFHDDIQKGCSLNPRIGAIPINQLEPIYGSIEPSFQNFALPGLLLWSVPDCPATFALPPLPCHL